VPGLNDEDHCGVIRLVSSVHPPSISMHASDSTRRSAATKDFVHTVVNEFSVYT
jgi:hypothetical protein